MSVTLQRLPLWFSWFLFVAPSVSRISFSYLPVITLGYVWVGQCVTATAATVDHHD